MFPTFLAMHIPDGFLSVPVSIFGWVLFIVLLGIALRQTQKQLGERQIPLMGILAAFVFAAQMLNFPVAGGTSGHLLGATLVAIFLGPWAMVLVMASVIGVQAVVFQDGGLLALGFNVVNMGIISGLVGYTVYTGMRGLLGRTPTAGLVGAGVGAWLGVVVASIATALELAVSGTSPLNIALPTMIGVHILIGLGEALITVAAVAFVRQTRPDLLDHTAANRGSRWVAVGLVIALALAFASPLANPNPDGLERVAEDQGFLDKAEEPAYTLLPDYTVPFIQSETFTTIAAGVIGVLLVGAMGFGMGKLANHQPAKRAHSPEQSVSG
ncbi:MAG: energy-coupling factor ABC transporter permease [Anaerolineaceae bacterium]|nr:energy-coupling factor ABC transporter permease [Anaerolineaceae bacterium]